MHYNSHLINKSLTLSIILSIVIHLFTLSLEITRFHNHNNIMVCNKTIQFKLFALRLFIKLSTLPNTPRPKTIERPLSYYILQIPGFDYL